MSWTPSSARRAPTFLVLLLLSAGAASLVRADTGIAVSTELDAGELPLDAGVAREQGDSGMPVALSAALLPVQTTESEAFSAGPPARTLPLGEPVVDVQARGGPSIERQRLRSSEAVSIVDLVQAGKRSSDLGEVLARTAGVSVRRYGGLGSDFRFSLNGLYDAQVRFFVDGVPIDRVYATSLANTPVNLIENAEVYRGVVPLRLGADALGGAVNLVTRREYETRSQASYLVGSFNTHRLTLSTRYRHAPTGIIGGIDSFFDYADNDYRVDVKLTDPLGRSVDARVPRFHDRYWAYGVAVEAGVADKKWAQRLLVRAFTSQYEKQIQHNVQMTVPYGEPYYGETIRGTLLTYRNTFARVLNLDVAASYTHRAIDFVDKGSWRYDWRGRRVAELRIPGELARERDQTIWQQGAFGRVVLDAKLAEGHTVTATVSPDFVTRTGEQRRLPDPNARDPLTAERRAFKLVSGLGYTVHAAPLPKAPASLEQRRPDHYRIENTLFAKSYVYRANSEQPLSGNQVRRFDQQQSELGVGDTFRVTLLGDYLLGKVSYELASRLPDPDEIFGNGVLIQENLDLRPERGHNVNIGPQLDLRRTAWGTFWVDINGFYRDTRDQIVLFGRDINFIYDNIYRTRTLGIENSVRWSSPKRYLNLDAQVTYMEQRNVSKRGTFGGFEGDRIPHRPWLFASWGSFLRFEGVLHESDKIEPFYQGRFVESFFFGWESVGLRDSKATIPSQTSHTLGITYAIDVGRTSLHGTLDIQNLTDARLYDAFGVQRPGRAYYFKLVAEL